MTGPGSGSPCEDLDLPARLMQNTMLREPLLRHPAPTC
ncbi:hypothetical protein C8D03_4009 [Bosea sp. 124]|nr:hypothetical protein C8D03_4009 [Bosea sp. 124]